MTLETASSYDPLAFDTLVALDAPGASGIHDPFERAVQVKSWDLRVTAEARKRLAAESSPAEPFDASLLFEVPDLPTRWRVQGLLPAEGRLLLAAQRKTGKTTVALNLVRDLLTGSLFLDRFDVEPIPGRIAFLNYEVSSAQLARWARETGIPGDRLLVISLRGRRNPLSDVEDTERLAKILADHEVQVAIVDPFGRAYTGLSQNDAGEVGSWLGSLDRLANTAGIKELVLTAHAGWNGERTRGSSALEDWADAVAYLTRDPDDETRRYFRAIGRDVDVDEDEMHYDPATRRLSLTGVGSRKAARDTRRYDDLATAVVEVVTEKPGINGVGLGNALHDRGTPFRKGAERQAAHNAVADGRLRTEKGPRGAICYHPNPHLPPPTPTYPAGQVPRTPTFPIGGGTWEGHVKPPHTPTRIHTHPSCQPQGDTP